MRKTRFKVINNIQIFAKIPELRASIAAWSIAKFAWLVCVAVFFPLAAIAAVALFTAEVLGRLLDFLGRISVWRLNEASEKSVSKAHDIVSPEDIRKRMGWNDD